MSVRNLIATATTLLLAAAWMLSGVLGTEAAQTPPTLKQSRQADASAAADAAPVAVRGRASRAAPRPRLLTLRGRTETKRAVVVRAEVDGVVVRRPVENGARVDAGDLLCALAVDDREAAVAEARDALRSARLEFAGAERLRRQDMQAESALARARAARSSAARALARSEMLLAKTAIGAPVAGYVERTHANVGDYMRPGDPCATILDLDPIHLVAGVPEKHVGALAIGAPVEATLSTGAAATGVVSFIGKQSSDASRTFRLEVAVANPDYAISSGLTALLAVPLGMHSAHRVNAALFVLDDDGNLGIRTAGADGRVEFHRVDILDEDDDGVWVSGLPEQITLITVGHELVIAGERVVVQPERQAP